jgi:hypothetical protein
VGGAGELSTGRPGPEAAIGAQFPRVLAMGSIDLR